MSRNDTSLTTIQRAFEVLDLLWELDGSGPTELAEKMDLPDSTVYEYLRSLSETKYVIRKNGEYSLSTYFLTIAGKMRRRNRLFQIAKSEMQRVASETNELIGLTIENGGKAVVLHKEEGDHALNLGIYPGAVTPLHTVATGKAILAHLPDDRINEIIEDQELEQRTEHTITDPDELQIELEQIRENDHAIDWNEQVIGMGMAAVPLIVDDRILGSLAIVVPTSRIQDNSYQQKLLRQLQEMENTITVNYQYGK